MNILLTFAFHQQEYLDYFLLFPSLVVLYCCWLFFGFVGLVWFFACERSLRKLQFKTTIEDGLNFYFCMTFLFNR